MWKVVYYRREDGINSSIRLNELLYKRLCGYANLHRMSLSQVIRHIAAQNPDKGVTQAVRNCLSKHAVGLPPLPPRPMKERQQRIAAMHPDEKVSLAYNRAGKHSNSSVRIEAALARLICDYAIRHNLTVSQLINDVVKQNPDQGATPAVRAWAEQLRQGADPPIPQPTPTPRPGVDSADIAAYLPTGITQSPDYAALTLRQRHAIGDLHGGLMWWTKVGKFAIIVRKFEAPVVISTDGEMAAIRWQPCKSL
jgi:predicted DNA-binding ribbon-helix-helix protein